LAEETEDRPELSLRLADTPAAMPPAAGPAAAAAAGLTETAGVGSLGASFGRAVFFVVPNDDDLYSE